MPLQASWTAERLTSAPLIAPARHYIWPQAIAGEEDALARGAVLLMVKPREGGNFLLTCALGFRDSSMPSGVWQCPDPDWICVLAGGYAYLANTLAPAQVTLLALKPVVEVMSTEELLLFVGFQSLVGWGRQGLLWQTERLSWEGVRVTSLHDNVCVGFGWDLMADQEREFRVDLQTGKHTGGGWQR